MHIGGVEAIVILVVVLLLFGASRLPGLAKSAGESISIFKKASKMDDEEESEPAKENV